MIQFNLLPDVKQDFMKAQALKRLMVSVSLIASAVALAVLVLEFSTVYLVQKKAINDLKTDITTESRALKNSPNISNILTVQSQLKSLSTLNTQKPVVSRIFSYLAQVTPTQATISDMRVDFVADTMTVNGNAPSLDVVNTFADGLKFTNFKIKGSSDTQPAFSSVVLSSFSRSNKAATYAITFSFDPAIFDTENEVTLTVGNTNSASQPSVIFKKES